MYVAYVISFITLVHFHLCQEKTYCFSHFLCPDMHLQLMGLKHHSAETELFHCYCFQTWMHSCISCWMHSNWIFSTKGISINLQYKCFPETHKLNLLMCKCKQFQLGVNSIPRWTVYSYLFIRSWRWFILDITSRWCILYCLLARKMKLSLTTFFFFTFPMVKGFIQVRPKHF